LTRDEIEKLATTSKAGTRAANKIVKEVYQNFVLARDHENRKKYRDETDAADRAFEGKIFTEEQESKLMADDIPIVKTNKGAINSIRYASILTASRPEITALAIGGGDAGISTLIKRDFKKTWRNNRGNKQAFRAVLDSVNEGLGWIDVYSERYNGLENRTIIERCPATLVLVDPVAKDPWDANFTIKARKVTEQYAIEMHGLKKSELHYVLSPADMEEGKTGKTVDSEPGGKYSDAPDSSGNQDDLNEWERDIWEMEYYQKLKYSKEMSIDEANPASETVKVIYEDLFYCFVCGKKLVEWKVNPEGKDNTGKPVKTLIPLPNIPTTKGPYSKGNLFYAIPALQELSKRRGQSIAVVSHTMGSPIIVDQKAGVNIPEWERKITKPRAILQTNAQSSDFRPQPLYPVAPDLSRVFMLEERASQDADNAWQLTPALKGEAETAKMSGRLAMLLKESGLEGSSYFMVALEGFFQDVATAVVALELKNQYSGYWEELLEDEDYVTDPATGEKAINPQTGTPVLKKQIAEALAKLKEGNIDILNYDIAVQPGSSLPSNRTALLELFDEMRQKPTHPEAPIDNEAFLEYLDVAGREEIMKRKSLTKRMAQQIQQLQGQLKQMAEQGKQMAEELRVRDTKMAKMKLDKDVEIAAKDAQHAIEKEEMKARVIGGLNL